MKSKLQSLCLKSLPFFVFFLSLLAAAGSRLTDANSSAAVNSSAATASGRASTKLFIDQRQNQTRSSRARTFGNAPSAPTITATLTDNLATGTKVLPGSTINYTAVINNTGTDATTVNFSDMVDLNTTLVSGSVHASPIAFNDTYNWVGNTFLDTNARSLPSVTANDIAVNPAGGTDTFALTTLTNAATALGGTVTLGANGHFTYTPPVGRPNAADGASVNDSFNYTLTNSANGTLTATGTVTIALTGRVWYLQAGASGDGRSSTPSGNPATMSTSADKASDIFYVFSSGGNLNGAFTLDSGQQLLGQGISLVVNSITLFTAGSAPTITNTGGNTVNLNGTNGTNSISGLTVGNSSGIGITGTNFGTLTVSSVAISNGNPGQALMLSNGTVSGTGFTAVSSTGGTNNVSLTSVSGTLVLGTGALSGATGPSFNVNAGGATVTYSGNITQSNNAALLSVTGGHTGTLTFQTGTLSATNGTGLQFDNADGTYNFNGTTTLNGGDAGIDIINGSGGTFSFPSTTSINNPSGVAYREDASTANVNFAGPITKNNNANNAVDINAKSGGTTSFNGSITASTTTANAIDLTNTGGTINFSGGLSITTTSGVGFNATGGGTVNATQNNTSILNTVSTTTGVGVNIVTPTNIGASGVTFHSVTVNNGASNSATGGIVLNGTTGAFTVTGDGTLARNGSGGTINKVTDDAIALTNASNVTLQSMNLTNNGDTAPATLAQAEDTTGDQTVQVSGGSNIILSGVLIQNPTGSGMVVLNVGGTNRVNNQCLFTSFVDGGRHGIFVNNVNTNMTLFEFKNSTMNNSLNDASMFIFENTGTSNMTLDVKGSTFENLDVQALSVFGGGSAATTGTLTATIGGPNAADRNFFQHAHSFVVGGVTISAENNVGIVCTQGATENVTLENNLFDDIAEDGTIAGTSIIRTQNAGGKLTATVKNNVVQNINFATSAGGRHVIGHVFEPPAFNAADFTNLIIDGNSATNVTYTNTNREFIFVDYRNFASGGSVKIVNNNWNMPSVGSQQGMELRFRQANASTVNLLVDNNGQGTGATHNTSGDFLDIDAEMAAIVNAAVTNNRFTDSDPANGEAISVASETAGTSTLRANITGNNISAAGNSIELNQVGTLTIEQSSANLASNNGGATIVTSAGSPTFSSPAPAFVSVAVSPASVTENGVTNLTYTLTRTGSLTAPLVANFSTIGTASFNGTADYAVTGSGVTFNTANGTGTATFNAGNATTTVTVDPTGDGTPEPDETVVLIASSGSYASGTITNDDGPAAPIGEEPTTSTPTSNSAREIYEHERSEKDVIRPHYAVFKKNGPFDYTEVLSLSRAHKLRSVVVQPTTQDTTTQSTGKEAPQSGETVTVPVGTLPQNKSITIKYSVTVNNPPAAAQVSTQGTVSGTGFTNVLTDDPDTGTVGDPTVTLIDLTITWTGATSINWDTDTNWNTAKKPVSLNDVLIPTAGVTNNPTISASDVTINTFTMQASRTLTMSSARTLNVAGNWTNNGTLTAGDGTVVFNGNNNTQTLAGSTTFNNLTSNHTGTGNVTATGSTLAVTGLMRVQAGTFISSSNFKDVQIDSGATLQSDGSTMNVSGNWTNNGGTFTPGAGTVIFNNTSAGQTIGGTATSQTFNNLQVNKNTQTLIVGGSTTTLNLNGTLTLTAGTFDVGTALTINSAGNWTNNGGTFTPGTGTVVFNSTTAAQAINGTAVTQTFGSLTVNKTGQTLSVAGSTTTLNLNGAFLLTAGIFDKGTAASITILGNWTKNGGTFTQGTGTVLFSGGSAQTIGGSSATTFNNLTINNASGVTINAAETVSGTLTLTLGLLTNGTNLTLSNGALISRSGGSINQAPTFGTTVNVTYTAPAPPASITTGPEIPVSTTVLSGLTINNSSGVTLNANATVNGALTFTSGNLTTNANVLSVAAAGTTSRTSGHVIGNLKKTFGAAGSFIFHVGTANGYSPVNSSITAGTGDLTVLAVQAAQPNVNASTSLQRYWTLTGTGNLTANLVFNYLQTDVMGNETAYRIIRVSGGTAVSFPNACPSPCVDTTANTGTINGVTSFSDWWDPLESTCRHASLSIL